MSVVLRCPSCGTTTATPGACEACHEAEVRYFCANHTPGLWLDASLCPECGARFGEPARPSPPPTPPVVIRPAPRAPAPSPPPTPPDARLGGWVPAERPPEPADEGLPPGVSRSALWGQILAAAVRAVSMRMTAPREPATPPLARRAAGCLMPLLVLFLFLCVAVAGAIYLFGHALLQGWFQL